MTMQSTVKRLKGRVAVITGSSSGIGSAVAEAYACEGAKVVVNYSRNRSGAEATAARIEAAGGEVLVVKADVSNSGDVQRMVAQTHEVFGAINILVNNAALLPAGSWDSQTEQQWDRMLDVNLKGPFLCTRAVQGDMKAAGYGKIINVSSVVFVEGYKVVDYTSSKAGLVGFTRSLAGLLGPYNICVNAILPGLICNGEDSVLDDPNQWGDDVKRVVGQQLLKCVGRPRFTIGAFIFLASHESDFVTGSCLAVDGGYTRY